MRLNPEANTIVRGGEILFEDEDLLKLSERRMQRIRGPKIAMVFQDPMTSLDPTMRIGRQISESLKKHLDMSGSQATERAVELLKLVGIPNPEDRLRQYPHQFSGGMRQRVVIAIALSCDPQILIADEPTTALDVTIQAQILELMRELQERLGMSIILITHDLGVVASTAHRIGVMYGGKIVETGTVREIFYNPQMPYTWGLLASIPLPTADREPGADPDPRFSAERARPTQGLPLHRPLPLRHADLRGGDARVHDVLGGAQGRVLATPPDGPKGRATGQGQGDEMTDQAKDGTQNGSANGRPLLEVKDLKKYFRVGRENLKAVDGISLEINKGETFGLVGESGCGKSTAGRVLVRLYDPSGGEVLYGGENIHEATGDEGRALNRKMQMIFQDPQASLNPRMVVGDIIAEGIDIHGLAENRKERLDRVHELLETVGLSQGARRPLPARVLGRPEAEDRGRAGPSPSTLTSSWPTSR